MDIAWHIHRVLNRVLPSVLVGPRVARAIPPVLAHNGYSRAKLLSGLTGLSVREVIRKLYLPGELVTVEVAGSRVSLRPGTSDATTLSDTFCDGLHVPLEPLADSPVILDLGSNIGATLLDYCHRYPRAHILGVELDGDNAEIARSNIAGLGNADLVHAGVVADRRDSVAYGGSPVLNHGYSVGAGDQEAPAINVADLLQRLGDHIHLLKMDIEGAEKEVLSSPDASAWASAVDLILIEVHMPWSIDACVAAVERLGFSGQPDPRSPHTHVVATRGPNG